MAIERRPATVLQVLALLAAIGLSGYLTYTKATDGIPPCTVGGGCAAALYSKWGYVADIPVAYIGLTASSLLLLLAPWRAFPLRALSTVLFLAGAAFTIYLRYVEQAHFDGHMCMWCVAFMVAWWIAMAGDLRRQIAPSDDGEDDEAELDAGLSPA